MTVQELGFYGPYGGRYVPETLVPALDELVAGWDAARQDPAFRAELDDLGRTFGGGPKTPSPPRRRFTAPSGSGRTAGST
jgi:tryptophan synthase beta chain